MGESSLRNLWFYQPVFTVNTSLDMSWIIWKLQQFSCLCRNLVLTTVTLGAIILFLRVLLFKGSSRSLFLSNYKSLKTTRKVIFSFNCMLEQFHMLIVNRHFFGKKWFSHFFFHLSGFSSFICKPMWIDVFHALLSWLVCRSVWDITVHSRPWHHSYVYQSRVKDLKKLIYGG